MRAIVACAAGLLVLAGAYLWVLGGTAPGAVGGAFVLRGADGAAVTDRDFRGRFALLYFGYTRCEDVCPTTLAQVGVAMDALGAAADRVRPVFVSVDTARDTPADADAYARAFSPRLTGLAGSPAQMAALARAFRVSMVVHPGGSIDHGSVLYLLGPDGRFLAPIRADESGAEMAAELRRWLGPA